MHFLRWQTYDNACPVTLTGTIVTIVTYLVTHTDTIVTIVKIVTTIVTYLVTILDIPSLSYLCHLQGCPIWPIIGSYWHQKRKIFDFLKPFFCSFWLCESNTTQNSCPTDLEKSLNGSRVVTWSNLMSVHCCIPGPTQGW